MPRKPIYDDPWHAATRRRQARYDARRKGKAVPKPVEDKPIPAPSTLAKPESTPISAYEEWQPGDPKKAAKVRASICAKCPSVDGCEAPCERFRLAYEATA